VEYSLVSLFDAYGAYDSRNTEIQVAEPLVAEASAWQVQATILQLNKYKSPRTSELPAKLIKTGGKVITPTLLV
jgi:hypothetical protein